MTSPHSFDSDWDYQDAINQERARFEAFVENESAFNEMLRGNIENLTLWLWDELPAETMALCKAVRAADYRPVALNGWNIILDESDDEDDDIQYLDSSPVIFAAFFCNKNLPESLKEIAGNYVAMASGPLADSEWVFEKFIKMEKSNEYL